jgi:phospholipid/cholesterol/gamma-HCH transport system substrate-binding protein
MPRTRSLAWAQLRVGVLAIAGLVLTAVFIFLIGGAGGFAWQQYHLKTRFADVQGLKTGAVVRVAGVEVGTVHSTEFVGSEVEVVMRVSKRMQDKIRSDSRASIGSLSLLGASVIDVSPSATGTMLPDWGFVPSTRPYGQLSSVAEGATRGLEEATKLLQDLRRGRGTVGRLFTDERLYQDISQFVESAEQVVGTLNRGEGTLGRLLKDPATHDALKASLQNLSDITSRLNRGDGSLGQLLRDDRFATSISATADNLEQLTARVNRGEGTLGKLATDQTLFTRLSTVSERLDGVLRRLSDGEGTAGRLLQDKQLYENMNETVSELKALIGDIRKDPKKYLNVRVSLF